MKKIIISIIVLALLAAGGGWLVFRSQLTPERVQALLAEALGPNAPVKVTLGGFTMGFPSSFHITDVTILPKAGGEPLLTCKSADAVPAVGSTLGGTPALQELTLSGLTFNVIRDANGQVNYATLFGAQTTWLPDTIRRLTGRDEPPPHLVLPGRALAMGGALDPTKLEASRILLKDSQVVYSDKMYNLDLRFEKIAGEASLKGPVLEVKEVSGLFQGAVEADIAGRVDFLQGYKHEVTLTTADTDLTKLQDSIPALAGFKSMGEILSGNIPITLSFSGGAGLTRRVDVAFQVNDFLYTSKGFFGRTFGASTGSMTLQVLKDPGQPINVSSELDVAPAETRPVEGAQGTVARADELKASLGYNGETVTISSFRGRLGEGTFSGSGFAKGLPYPTDYEIDVTAKSIPAKLLPYLGNLDPRLKAAMVSGTARKTPDGVTVTDGEVVQGNSSIQIEGTLDDSSGAVLPKDLVITGELDRHAVMDVLGLLPPHQVRGRVKAAVKLQEELRFEGSASSDDFEYGTDAFKLRMRKARARYKGNATGFGAQIDGESTRLDWPEVFDNVFAGMGPYQSYMAQMGYRKGHPVPFDNITFRLQHLNDELRISRLAAHGRGMNLSGEIRAGSAGSLNGNLKLTISVMQGMPGMDVNLGIGGTVNAPQITRQ